MNCLDLMIGFVSMYTRSPRWSLRMLQSFQMVIGLLLIVLFLCYLWWFLYIFIVGSDLIYWTSCWWWRLDLALHFEESPLQYIITRDHCRFFNVFISNFVEATIGFFFIFYITTNIASILSPSSPTLLSFIIRNLIGDLLVANHFKFWLVILWSYFEIGFLWWYWCFSRCP